MALSLVSSLMLLQYLTPLKQQIELANMASPPATVLLKVRPSSIKLGDFKLLDVAAVGSFISSAACRLCELDPAPTWIFKKYADVKNQTFFGIKKAGSNADLASNVNVIIIAVKPISVNGVLNEIKDFVKESLIISIAAGVETSQLENLLNDGTRVIRVMPNAAAAIQRGATVVSRGSNAVDEDEALTVNLFQSVGYCVKLPESLLNAVTGLSGSGPAYCFMAIDAVGDGGSMLGLPRDIAMKLAAHTMIGAAEMFLQTEKHPMALKDSVCSVGGTTLYGINYLDSNKFRGIIHGVIKAGHDRAVELSELNKP